MNRGLGGWCILEEPLPQSKSERASAREKGKEEADTIPVCGDLWGRGQKKSVEKEEGGAMDHWDFNPQ
jgi:hypothetical protein